MGKRTGLKDNMLTLHFEAIQDLNERFFVNDGKLCHNGSGDTCESSRIWAKIPSQGKRVHLSLSSVIYVVGLVQSDYFNSLQADTQGMVSIAISPSQEGPKLIEIGHLNELNHRRLAELFFMSELSIDFGNAYGARANLSTSIPASYLEDILGISLDMDYYDVIMLPKDFKTKWSCRQANQIMDGFSRIKKAGAHNKVWDKFVTSPMTKERLAEDTANHHHAVALLNLDFFVRAGSPSYLLRDGALVLLPPLWNYPAITLDKAGHIIPFIPSRNE
jgi:hypothetical protein